MPDGVVRRTGRDGGVPGGTAHRAGRRRAGRDGAPGGAAAGRGGGRG
ncbi:hypothetical protein [Actinomadura sp. 3N508]